MPNELQEFDIYRNPRGSISCQGKLSYRGPVSSRDLPRIKLDLTADERVVLEPLRVPIYHPYSDAPEEGIEALAYDYTEAFAEKFRALGERTRPRDLYDVVNLYRNADARPEPANLLGVLREKCAFKGIEVPRFADLEAHRGELEAGWQHMLAHQLPALLPVQSFWDELPVIFDWLTGAVVPKVLPAMALGASDIVIRERSVSLPVGSEGQSHVERIRFAAANQLIIELDYRDQTGRRSTRAIEAYSLRRSRAGDVLLMAVREADGQPRSYRLDNIVGVASTQRTFSPRYPIELTPTGPQSIPLTAAAGSVGTLTRRQPARRRAAVGGPTYVFRCSVCGKEFQRKTHDATLRPHKNKSGRDCYSTYGRYVRTKVLNRAKSHRPALKGR